MTRISSRCDMTFFLKSSISFRQSLARVRISLNSVILRGSILKLCSNLGNFALRETILFDKVIMFFKKSIILLLKGKRFFVELLCVFGCLPNEFEVFERSCLWAVGSLLRFSYSYLSLNLLRSFGAILLERDVLTYSG